MIARFAIQLGIDHIAVRREWLHGWLITPHLFVTRGNIHFLLLAVLLIETGTLSFEFVTTLPSLLDTKRHLSVIDGFAHSISLTKSRLWSSLWFPNTVTGVSWEFDKLENLCLVASLDRRTAKGGAALKLPPRFVSVPTVSAGAFGRPRNSSSDLTTSLEHCDCSGQPPEHHLPGNQRYNSSLTDASHRIMASHPPHLADPPSRSATHQPNPGIS